MKFALVVAALCALASVSVALVPTAEYSFEQYVADHSKVYKSDAETAMRRSLFQQSLDLVLKHNARQDKTWTIGINQFSDRTEEEKSAVNGYHRGIGYKQVTEQVQHKDKMARMDVNESELPSSVDWRQHEPAVVSPVKNQGQCGSCWTFATAETVESHHALKYPGELQALSEQQVASCPFGSNPKNCGGTGGCQGGTAEVGFQSIMSAGGLTSEWLYPYRSIFGNDYACDSNEWLFTKHATISSYKKLPSNEYAPLMSAVANLGPIAISVDASAWHNYEGGVFDGCNQTNPVIDHAVQLVGYGTDAQLGPYWLVRNSWSPFWGENGYIRIKRTPDQLRCGTDNQPMDGNGCEGGPSSVKACGTCGILFDSSYPIIG